MNVTIHQHAPGKLLVETLHHPDFPERARRIGGRFTSAPRKGWVFDARDEGRVRELCRNIFGTDGSPLPKDELLTVRAPARVCDARGQVRFADRPMSYWLAGREVARAMGRDSGARLGEGVVVLRGGFGSAGSVKNPSCTFEPGTLFELRDVPRSLAEKVHAEYHGVTLLDEAGAVVAEATYAPGDAAGSVGSALEELCCAARTRDASTVAALELEVARAEGRLAGLRWRLAEARAYS